MRQQVTSCLVTWWLALFVFMYWFRLFSGVPHHLAHHVFHHRHTLFHHFHFVFGGHISVFVFHSFSRFHPHRVASFHHAHHVLHLWACHLGFALSGSIHLTASNTARISSICVCIFCIIWPSIIGISDLSVCWYAKKSLLAQRPKHWPVIVKQAFS